MNIVLLGHYDIASLTALARLVAAAPGHSYTAFLSGDLAPRDYPVRAFDELARQDRRYCYELLHSGALPDALQAGRPSPDPHSAEGLATLAACDPDLVVSIRYRRILRGNAIAIPRHGVLNLHSGILPDYKGVMATFWAMLHREAEIGATLHRIVDSGIDTGPVLGICRLEARYDASYLANVLALYGPGCELFVHAIGTLATGGTPETCPQLAGGRYFSTPGNADVERFIAAGMTLADGNEFKASGD